MSVFTIVAFTPLRSLYIVRIVSMLRIRFLEEEHRICALYDCTLVFHTQDQESPVSLGYNSIRVSQKVSTFIKYKSPCSKRRRMVASHTSSSDTIFGL